MNQILRIYTTFKSSFAVKGREEIGQQLGEK